MGRARRHHQLRHHPLHHQQRPLEPQAPPSARPVTYDTISVTNPVAARRIT